MRPVDQKLKYQVQKMMRIAASGKIEKNDPLSFRANPDAFDSDNDEETTDAANGGLRYHLNLNLAEGHAHFRPVRAPA